MFVHWLFRMTYIVPRFVLLIVSAMVPMIMPSVHEQVHQRAGQKNEVGQIAENVLPVFRQQEIGDRADQAQRRHTLRCQPKRFGFPVHS